VTVAALRIHATISSPKRGTTLSKFKITRAAQYDIFPDTTTYPVNAVASESRNIALPTTHTKNFWCEATCENAMDFPRCAKVAITTKLAQSICSKRSNHARFPWKAIEISSTYWTSREYAIRPSKMNPVMICATQKTNATNAMLCPKYARFTGNN